MNPNVLNCVHTYRYDNNTDHWDNHSQTTREIWLGEHWRDLYTRVVVQLRGLISVCKYRKSLVLRRKFCLFLWILWNASPFSVSSHLLPDRRTRTFNTSNTRFHHWTQSWVNAIHRTYLRKIRLLLGLPSGRFPNHFFFKMLTYSLFLPPYLHLQVFIASVSSILNEMACLKFLHV